MNAQTIGPSQSLTQVLAQSTVFGTLIANITRLNQLTQALASRVEAPLLQQCRICAFDKGILTLLVPPPGLAHHFRYLAPELIAHLSTQTPWQGLKSLKIVVSADAPRPSAPPLTVEKPKLSASTAQLLNSTAQALPETPLKQALLRLCKI